MLHAGRQDVAILRRAWRTEVTNIFDTQIAAGFAGESAQTGYGNLLGTMLGLRVGKTASYTRWDARPLTAEQLSYAAEDVAHLLELADEVQRRLTETGRLSWAARSAAGSSPRATSASRTRRGSGCRASGSSTRAPARWRGELAAWRERTASDEDRPVGSVLRDPALVEIAKRHPSNVGASSRSAASTRRSSAGAARRCSRRSPPASTTPPIARDERAAARSPSDAPLIVLAEALLRARAIEAGLAYELIASRSELEQIVAAARQRDPEPDVRTLEGWRAELVGADLRDLLAGRKAISVGPGRRLVLGDA